MSLLSRSLNLEYGLLFVFDPEAPEAPPKDFDPIRSPLWHSSSSIILRAQNAVDGMTKVEIWQEPVELPSTMHHLGGGDFVVASGGIAIAGEPSWTPAARSTIPPGRYQFDAFGDTRDGAGRILIVLTSK